MINSKIIDGKAFAENLRADIKNRVAKLKAEKGVTPGLAVVLVGNDPASEVYVKNKGKQTIEAGMQSFEFHLPATTSEAELLKKIDELNKNPEVHGILVQLPLPKHINEEAVINAITPEKDVDGFNIINVGKLATGGHPYPVGGKATAQDLSKIEKDPALSLHSPQDNGDGFVPCTPLGCLMLLKGVFRHPVGGAATAQDLVQSEKDPALSLHSPQDGRLAGKHAVVIGRSNIVGKPMASLLLRESCTVTIAHSKTKDLPALLKTADIVVAAVGRPNMIKGEWLKAGAVVIDVGINRLENKKLVGDVDFASCQGIASAITPVPGGVGPMTIACLLENTYRACLKQNS